MTVPPELLSFARHLRKEQTDAETLLWYLLRGRRLDGFKFRRQYPVSGYILDFYCHEAGLAVELDGGGHDDDKQRLHDDERTKVLLAKNILVLRFWNNEVLDSLECVLEKIHAQLKLSPSSGLRPPSPSGRRDDAD